MAGGAVVAILGATGVLGEQLLEVLEDVDAVGAVIPVARATSEQSEVSFRGERVEVVALKDDDVERADVIVSALPGRLGREPLDRLIEEGIPVIDLAGVFGTSAPIVASGVRGEVGAIRETGVVTSPRPLALALAKLLRTLSEFGVHGVTGTALCPAGIAGREGVKELSGQVVAVFNSQEPPRRVFTKGLAFDLLPSWGAVGEKGWSGHELMVAIQLGLLAGIDPARVSVDMVVAPLFAGTGVSLRLLLSEGWELSKVVEVLKESDGFKLSSDPMPRRSIGRDELTVGRIRQDLGGGALHLWLSFDPQRLAARAAADLVEDLLRGEA